MTVVANKCERVIEAAASDFMFIDEFCRRLGCSESTLGRWIRRGLIPQPIRAYPGVRLAWRRGEAEAYLASLT